MLLPVPVVEADVFHVGKQVAYRGNCSKQLHPNGLNAKSRQVLACRPFVVPVGALLNALQRINGSGYRLFGRVIGLALRQRNFQLAARCNGTGQMRFHVHGVFSVKSKRLGVRIELVSA